MFDMTHPYFAKDYLKPSKVKPEEDDQLVPNVDSFFDLLPEPKHKVKKNRCSLVGLSKHERTLRALKKLRLRKEQMEIKEK